MTKKKGALIGGLVLSTLIAVIVLAAQVFATNEVRILNKSNISLSNVSVATKEKAINISEIASGGFGSAKFRSSEDSEVSVTATWNKLPITFTFGYVTRNIGARYELEFSDGKFVLVDSKLE